jgi:hypothetical protein
MAKEKLSSYLKELRGRSGSYIHYNVKGRQYVRSYAVPSNPRTAVQQKNRTLFAHAVKAWQGLSPEQKNIYNRKAAGRPFTGYNLFISMAMKGISAPLKDAYEKINSPGKIHSYSVCHMDQFRTISVPASGQVRDASMCVLHHRGFMDLTAV